MDLALYHLIRDYKCRRLHEQDQSLQVMIFLVIISILIGICVYYMKQNETKVPQGMKTLPIEKGWPIIGILNDIKGSLCNYLTKLRQKHGGIYLIRFGMRNVLVLNNIECMKAALVDNGEAFSGRSQLYNYIFMTRGVGVIFTEGNYWAEQRAYLLKTLKDFGSGKAKSVEMIQDECVYLLQDMENLHSSQVDFATFISLYTGNIISRYIMNRRFTHGDQELETIEDTLKIVADNKDTLAFLSLMLPFLDRNEWLMKFLVWVTSRNEVFSSSYGIFEKEIRNRLHTLDFNSEGEDLLDKFLIKQHRMKTKHGSVGTFTVQQLTVNAFELFIAGFDTTSSTLTWSFMFMAMYPDVQKKVYEEISDQIGTERLPTMSDKPSLVYTQAVMDEILRLGTVAPLSVLHKTLKDACVNGYFIPKNTLVMPNIFACHIDPSIWEKPLEFYPAHFLSSDENGDFKYKSREELVPFGMGKRQCLGESLARTEYFIFFVAVLQRFQVNLPHGMTVKTPFNVFQEGEGILRKALHKDFIFKSRI